MEEWEKVSAPFKLVVRLMRHRPASPFPPSSPASIEQQSWVKRFVGWEGFSFGFFTGLAFAFLQLPYQYEKARWCFILAAIALAIKVVHSVEARVYPRLLITGLTAVLAGLMVCRVNDWVTKLEVEAHAREVSEIRIITSGAKPIAPPVVSPRSYIEIAKCYFGRRDEKGGLLPDQDFKIGQPLSFDVDFVATGPNPVEILLVALDVFLEPSFDPDTQRAVAEQFKQRVRQFKKTHKQGEPNTMMKSEGGFKTAFATDDSNHIRKLTQSDLDALHSGTQIAFVIVEVTYSDTGIVHHARRCEYLQPPAYAPGIWHQCGFSHSD